MPVSTLPQDIRKAAEQAGGLEKFRRRWRLPNTTFYALLRGELPAKVSTRADLRKKLARAGLRPAALATA